MCIGTHVALLFTDLHLQQRNGAPTFFSLCFASEGEHTHMYSSPRRFDHVQQSLSTAGYKTVYLLLVDIHQRRQATTSATITVQERPQPRTPFGIIEQYVYFYILRVCVDAFFSSAENGQKTQRTNFQRTHQPGTQRQTTNNMIRPRHIIWLSLQNTLPAALYTTCIVELGQKGVWLSGPGN